MPKCWRIQTARRRDGQSTGACRGVSPVLARLLATRGVAEAEARIFLAGSLSDLRDPNSCPVWQRLRPDCVCHEGWPPHLHLRRLRCRRMTATAILASCLQAIHADVFWYVPDRFDEGYGPTQRPSARSR